ncbi:MAG: hypothetical protein EOM55_02010 [Clostridia bacterium]|nr:hypothetical protein [Clostridia bacterium]
MGGNRKVKLGLIGGVSPFAFSEIYNGICKRYRSIHDEYPHLIIYSVRCSISDEQHYIENTKLNNENILNELKNACEFFSKNGINNIGICCNTLSNVFKEIATPYNFNRTLTPIDAVLNKIKNPQSYFVFATRFTCDSHLFGHNVKYLESEDQKIIDSLLSIKIRGSELKKTNKKINSIVCKYDIKNIILGCTDFNKKDFSFLKTNIIDSSEIFIDECIEVLKCAES